MEVSLMVYRFIYYIFDVFHFACEGNMQDFDLLLGTC